MDVSAAAVPDLPKRVQVTLGMGKQIMPFEVKACSIEDIHRHPVLPDRSLARVKVTLRETRAPETFDHDLTLKVWAYTDNDMTPADVRTALLTKAAAM